MKSKLTKSLILKDLNNVLTDTSHEIYSNRQQALSDALNRLGYPYNINSHGEFRITITPGAYIFGKQHNSILYLEITYGDITARLDDFPSSYAIYYHPMALGGYGGIFSMLSDKMKHLIEKYDEMSKLDKRAKLLRSLMLRSLRINGLTKTELTPDYDNNSFTLFKRIAGNIYMFTKVDYENYEVRIRKMAEAFRSTVVSDLSELHDIKIYRSNHCINFKNIATGGATPKYDNLQFHYPDGADRIPAKAEHHKDDYCYDHLSKLGFCFEKNERRFRVVVNKHLFISRC